jgi:hypothetical protein
MFRVDVVPRRRASALPPDVVLALRAAAPELGVGRTTTLSESITNNGVSAVKRLQLKLSVPPGWRVKPLGRSAAPVRAPGRRFPVAYRITAPLLAPGQRLSVAYRIKAPPTGPPLAASLLTGAASYGPTTGRQTASATLGELVSSPVSPPLSTADVTTHPALFGASGPDLAISSRGFGVFTVSPRTPPTDSYAAIYAHAAAQLSSTAQVTVTSDPAGGVAGGAGLIERDDMTARQQSLPGVALYVSSRATIVMVWNSSGGASVDQQVTVPSVIRFPVALRLVRSASTYAGYYSTDGGTTWNPVATATVAAVASAGPQDVGVFHASGLETWTTTATFTNFVVQ